MRIGSTVSVVVTLIRGESPSNPNPTPPVFTYLFSDDALTENYYADDALTLRYAVG